MARSILLVEDSSAARRNIATFLERAGYQVAQADTGEDAVHLIESRGNFDVVVSDLRMPGMINGLDVLSCQNRIAPHTGSILMTAFGSDQVREQTRQLGAAYIESPSSWIRLFWRLKNTLAVSREPAGATQMSKYCAGVGIIDA
jgi:DNA-binding NtrC family response regulator